jgi:uncharacterized protein with ParB-like and HNH nuclease domain
VSDLAKLQTQLDQERRKVDVDHFDVTVREIIRMAEERELIRAPEYQRKFRWGHDDESKLIESLFLGLPVPSIFVATNTDSTWELVDGLQRVSTLLHYLSSSQEIFKEIGKNSPLRLEKLEKLSEFNGKTFKDLPTTIQLAFYKRSLRITALSDKSDMVARFDLFERLNTGGIALSPQEVRSCIFRGKFAEFIRRLSDEQLFREVVKLQEKKQNDGTAEELVLKFFAYLHNRSNFKGDVKGFLNDYMKTSSNSFDYDSNEKLFRDTLRVVFSSLNGPFLRKNVHVTPLNQLEGVMVGIGKALLAGIPIKTPAEGWVEDKELVESSTRGTNTRNMLERRVNRAFQLFTNEN